MQREELPQRGRPEVRRRRVCVQSREVGAPRDEGEREAEVGGQLGALPGALLEEAATVRAAGGDDAASSTAPR